MHHCTHCGKNFRTERELEAHKKMPRCRACGHSSKRLHNGLCPRCHRGKMEAEREGMGMGNVKMPRLF